MPRSPKASGIEVESTSPASISASSISRTGHFSGSSQLVTHAVSIHAHHTAMNRSSVSNAPSTEKWAMRLCESWVMAKTKTRSKNSSMKPTRAWSCGPRTRRRLIRAGRGSLVSVPVSFIREAPSSAMRVGSWPMPAGIPIDCARGKPLSPGRNPLQSTQIRIGTRGSPLALAQAAETRAGLPRRSPYRRRRSSSSRSAPPATASPTGR